MEFRDIEYVCAIATYKSITKAAESLFITQPTLSQYIKNMEKRLGVEIFYREGNHIYPTYEGNIFIEEGKKLIRDRDILINMLNDSIQKERGTLKIAVPLQRGSALLSAILPKFHQQFPNVEIQLEEGSINHLVKHVKEGFSDLVFFKSV